MGADIPESVASQQFHASLEKEGLIRIHQGKVRDTYTLPGRDDLLFLIATDRLSIFDFVLPGLVEDKGAVLTGLTVFWLTRVLKGVEHHMVACGKEIAGYLPEGLQVTPEMMKRSMVVRKLKMMPVESVVRGYLTGSGWSAYKRDQAVCGHLLEEGLHDGSHLPAPLYTPTTKAEIGHDEHISAQSVRDEFGLWQEELTLKVYGQISDFARERGIILADTKFEFGEGGILGDEVATPDSSRFWDGREWEEAIKEQRSPAGYDKQPVREWGKTQETPFSKDGAPILGINKLDTENADHLAFVHGLSIPENVLAETTKRYRRIFELLADQSLEDFQKNVMGI